MDGESDFAAQMRARAEIMLAMQEWGITQIPLFSVVALRKPAWPKPNCMSNAVVLFATSSDAAEALAREHMLEVGEDAGEYVYVVSRNVATFRPHAVLQPLAAELQPKQ